MKIVGWVCPFDAHIISDAEMQAARWDYGCSKCGASFKYFKKHIFNFPEGVNSVDDGKEE